jgi:hypothetical protein
MTDFNDRAERRKQNRLEKLGTNHPICPLCGETDWRCFELHHIAGRKFDPMELPVCMNCHAKCSDLQKDHPPRVAQTPGSLEVIGRFLVGLADMLGLAASKLKEFGLFLIEEARKAIQSLEETPV